MNHNSILKDKASTITIPKCLTDCSQCNGTYTDTVCAELTFVHYEEEFKNIWIDIVNVTKSSVLKREDDNGAFAQAECSNADTGCFAPGSTNTGPTRQPLISSEFQTAKKILIKKLHESKDRKIKTKCLTIRLNSRGSLQFVKKVNK